MLYSLSCAGKNGMSRQQYSFRLREAPREATRDSGSKGGGDNERGKTREGVYFIACAVCE